ncbi:sporulation initiation factor Spo0A C-terminal domain-containing protein [Anaerotignum sp.]|uniref:sporulation initiation factor Spo0A C-terminal domain-containing protein n=1 Tax=Anaerotignum sp. TaxID=2039241 RepID=UPI0028A2396A|nr:sporulation initiation factor Spo0A C-terminal domain-containing protein [Anaerotignum sp.]
MRLSSIYEKIAEEYGISVSEVKREMQAAIESAYRHDRNSEIEMNIQEGVKCKDKIPSVEEFILSLSCEIKQRAKNKRY